MWRINEAHERTVHKYTEQWYAKGALIDLLLNYDPESSYR